MVNAKKQKAVPAVRLPRLLFLGVCFFLGVFLGQGIAFQMPELVFRQLDGYLAGFLALEERKFSDTFLPTLILYIRYPLTAFFLGFARIGAVLLPLLGFVCGLFLSFSVGCFAASFGVDGIFLAMAVLGLRVCITMPCFFYLALPSWETACANRFYGRSKPSAHRKYLWLRLALVLGILLLGVCLDLMISPYLLEQVLRRCF